ncbi:serum response factor-binding protein 1 [Indicator indicator]|uniref:serum response factor-binding protein 1 n=1 Tax=Indicator indicator TaxID=1002788 RepID=UPI0023DE91F7|nr:serum response factor-binding protein 1 [Indicator indicator]
MLPQYNSSRLFLGKHSSTHFPSSLPEVGLVVKMRKDVKKARVLTVRRLTRHIRKLKLKNGSEDLKLKNQKRAERLIEEIHAMKEVKPDEVTRLALRTEVNFESVCRKPNCTATERAIARLASHPILKPKFVELKAAVTAFKDSRKSPAKSSPSKKATSEEEAKSAQPFNNNLDDQALKLAQKQQGCEHKTKISMKIETDRVPEELCESDSEQHVEIEKACAPEDSSLQAVQIQAVTQSKTGKKHAYQKRKENMSVNKLNAIKESKNDSKQKHPNEDEYFDDSTEERFYNQSSDSDSDSNDDFFIGKVKRKKKIAAVTDLSSAKEKDRLQGEKVLKKEKNTAPETAQDFIMEKGKPHAKGSKIESMFCSSLSTSNQKSESRRRNTKDQALRNGRKALLQKEPHLKKQQFAKAGSIKGDNKKAHLEQPLHPSWEASKRRREQMSQITAFQGKKIKFDD